MYISFFFFFFSGLHHSEWLMALEDTRNGTDRICSISFVLHSFLSVIHLVHKNGRHAIKSMARRLISSTFLSNANYLHFTATLSSCVVVEAVFNQRLFLGIADGNQGMAALVMSSFFSFFSFGIGNRTVLLDGRASGFRKRERKNGRCRSLNISTR